MYSKGGGVEGIQGYKDEYRHGKRKCGKIFGRSRSSFDFALSSLRLDVRNECQRLNNRPTMMLICTCENKSKLCTLVVHIVCTFMRHYLFC